MSDIENSIYQAKKSYQIRSEYLGENDYNTFIAYIQYEKLAKITENNMWNYLFHKIENVFWKILFKFITNTGF